MFSVIGLTVTSMIATPGRVTSFPRIPGHEVAGEVVEIGSEVKTIKVGQRVTNHSGHHIVHQRRWRPRQRRVGPHTAGVESGVVVTDPLEVLGRAEGHDGRPVADAEDGHLGPVEELLDDEAPVGLGETGASVLERLGARVRDDDALAGGQPVVLDDVRGAERVESGLDLVHRRAHVGEGSRHVGRGHDLLGEGLAALETSGLRGGPEDGEAGRPAVVGDTGDERRLGPHDDELDLVLAGEGRDRVTVEDVDRDAESRRVDARVAGGRDHRVDLRVGRNSLDECVFAGA